MIDTCIKHKGKRCHAITTKTWKCSVNLPFMKSLNQQEQRAWHHFLKTNRLSRRFSFLQFAMGLGNEMKFKMETAAIFVVSRSVSVKCFTGTVGHVSFSAPLFVHGVPSGALPPAGAREVYLGLLLHPGQESQNLCRYLLTGLISTFQDGECLDVARRA